MRSTEETIKSQISTSEQLLKDIQQLGRITSDEDREKRKQIIRRKIIEQGESEERIIFLNEIKANILSKEQRVQSYQESSVNLEVDYQKVVEGIANNMRVLEAKGQQDHEYYKSQAAALKILECIKLHHFEVAGKLYNVINQNQ